MLKFYVKVFYAMGKARSGELSCPCDRSCYNVTVNKVSAPEPFLNSYAQLQVKTEFYDKSEKIFHMFAG